MTTEHIKKLAYKALPHLIRCAQKRTTITYKSLGDILDVNPHRVISHVLGCIRDEICDPRGLPRINAIVVRADTHEPGEGFIPGGTSRLSEEEKTKLYELFRDQAFDYPGWNDLLSELGLEPIFATVEDLDHEAREYNHWLERHGGGGEGEDHRRLKEYIARHPDTIGLSVLKKPEQEHPFLSGDCCDILMQLMDKSFVIVEIKVGKRGELVKGIYQLVKYRVLLQAEQGHGVSWPAPKVHLVAYSIQKDVEEYACKFGIFCHIVTFLG